MTVEPYFEGRAKSSMTQTGRIGLVGYNAFDQTTASAARRVLHVLGERLVSAPMKIVYRITEQDYMAARDLFLANEKPWHRRISRRLIPWLGGLLLTTQMAYVMVVTDANREMAAVASLIAIYFLYCGFAIRRYFRRSYQNDRRFQHDFTTDISEDGILITMPTAESRMKWDNFVRFLESDDIFVLFHSDLIFNILPSVFTTERLTGFVS